MRFLFLFVLTLCSSIAYSDAPSLFTPCLGNWEGDFNVYSATGTKLETQKWNWSSVSERKGLQKIQINAVMSAGYTERQNGFYLNDSSGLRRILKTDQGKLVSDLRGKIVGPGKYYWFYVDVNGVLRESYLESIENGTFRIQGFRWDGIKAGSYRIIEAQFSQKVAQGTLPKLEQKASIK
jgi:hypothetical protein